MFAEFAGTVAYIPPMVFDGSEGWEAVQAYRIEVAGDRFVEAYLSFFECPFYHAVAPPLRVGSREDTVFAVDNLRYQFTFAVVVGYTFVCHHVTCGGRHHGQQHVEVLLYLLGFLWFERCSGIAFDTATAFALLQVATELLLDDVERNQGVLYLKHLSVNVFYIWLLHVPWLYLAVCL